MCKFLLLGVPVDESEPFLRSFDLLGHRRGYIFFLPSVGLLWSMEDLH